MTHLLAGPALDGLFLGPSAGRGLDEIGLSPTIWGFSSLEPDGIDHPKFFILQSLEVDVILVLVVVGDHGHGLDNRDWFLLVFLFLHLFHLLSKLEHFQWIGLSTFHDSMSEFFAKSGDEHLSLDKHLGGVQSKLDGVLDSGFFSIGQAVDGSLRHVGRDVAHLLGGSIVHLQNMLDTLAQ